jgi:kindlin 2
MNSHFLTDRYSPGIRHPEELSFCKPLEPNNLKYNLKDLPNKKRHPDDRNGMNGRNGHYVPADTNTFISNHSPSGSTGSLEHSSPPLMCAPVSPARSNYSANTPISSPASTVFM